MTNFILFFFIANAIKCSTLLRLFKYNLFFFECIEWNEMNLISLPTAQRISNKNKNNPKISIVNGLIYCLSARVLQSIFSILRSLCIPAIFCFIFSKTKHILSLWILCVFGYFNKLDMCAHTLHIQPCMESQSALCRMNLLHLEGQRERKKLYNLLNYEWSNDHFYFHCSKNSFCIDHYTDWIAFSGSFHLFLWRFVVKSKILITRMKWFLINFQILHGEKWRVAALVQMNRIQSTATIISFCLFSLILYGIFYDYDAKRILHYSNDSNCSHA